ncbi:uncharacterized protein [Ptychodera flava]|uniref:uncharacterized protein n=1 Tax=Ptychodera flava TaxID=63121 RepID=UPI00396A372C
MFVLVRWLTPRRYEGIEELVTPSRVRSPKTTLKVGDIVKVSYKRSAYKAKVIALKDSADSDWDSDDDIPLSILRSRLLGNETDKKNPSRGDSEGPFDSDDDIPPRELIGWWKTAEKVSRR